MPAVSTINRHDVFVCTLLHHELYNSADIYILDNRFVNVFAIIQLLFMLVLWLQASVKA